MNDKKLFEKLAAIEHERWADWQRYCHAVGIKNADGSITLPANLIERWDKQINTEYADLTEDEKDADRIQVRRYWDLVR